MLFQHLFDLLLTRPFFQYQFRVLLIPTPEAIANARRPLRRKSHGFYRLSPGRQTDVNCRRRQGLGRSTARQRRLYAAQCLLQTQTAACLV